MPMERNVNQEDKKDRCFEDAKVQGFASLAERYFYTCTRDAVCVLGFSSLYVR
jgi:hypothetical protein